jgi:hypothetical protein
MAIAFSDTFERADGPLGPDWQVDSSTWAIISGQASVGAAGRAHPVTQPTGANCCQRAWVTPPTSGNYTYAFWFRTDVNAQNYKYVTFVISPAAINVAIGHHVAGVNTNLSSIIFGQYAEGNVDLMAAVAGDELYAFVNGYLVLVAQAPVVQSNGHACLYIGGSALRVDEYALYDTGGAPFGVTVTPPTPPDTDYLLDLTNGGADWTPGTPGAPVFEVGTGTIVSQVISDANNAQVVYTPPTVDMQTAIYDPQNDFFFIVGLTTEPGVSGGGGGGGGLTTEQAATMAVLKIITDLFPADWTLTDDFYLQLGSFVLKTHDEYSQGGSGAFSALLDAILDSTNGIPALALIIRSIWDRLDAATDQGDSTLNGVEVDIRGINLRDLSEIYDLVDALGAPTGGDLTTILEQLALIRTANLWTLGHVIDAIAALPDPSTSLATIINILWEIRTVAHSYTLGDVMDAIAGIAAPDLSEVLAAIAAVRGSGNPDLAAVLSAIALIPTTTYGTQLTAIKDAVDAIPTNPITSLQSVLTAIAALSTALSDDLALILAAIEAITPATPAPAPPVWPGLAQATLGTPVALATGVTITEAMDGVIVNITGAPTKQGYFTYDDTKSWRNTGSLSFFNDIGAQEYQQYLGFETAIYCPKVMVRAAGVKLHCASGVTGTVTPWTITE